MEEFSDLDWIQQRNRRADSQAIDEENDLEVSVVVSRMLGGREF